MRDAGNKREHIQQRSMDMQAENQLEGSSNEGTGWRVEKCKLRMEKIWEQTSRMTLKFFGWTFPEKIESHVP